MAAVSQSHLNMVGSHCGVSIGEDGPSQMALEDMAAFRAIPNLVYFYPSGYLRFKFFLKSIDLSECLIKWCWEQNIV